MRYFVTLDGAEVPVDLEPLPGGRFQVKVGDGQPIEASLASTGDGVSVRLGGRMVDMMIEGTPPDVGVVAGGKRVYGRVESARAKALATSRGRGAGGAGEAVITSPMPGRVLKLLVGEGDEVKVGQSVAVVEAMKMENELKATRAGTVAKVFVAAGATVEAGAKLVQLG